MWEEVLKTCRNPAVVVCLHLGELPLCCCASGNGLRDAQEPRQVSGGICWDACGPAGRVRGFNSPRGGGVPRTLCTCAVSPGSKYHARMPAAAAMHSAGVR